MVEKSNLVDFPPNFSQNSIPGVGNSLQVGTFTHSSSLGQGRGLNPASSQKTPNCPSTPSSGSVMLSGSWYSLKANSGYGVFLHVKYT